MRLISLLAFVKVAGEVGGERLQRSLAGVTERGSVRCAERSAGFARPLFCSARLPGVRSFDGGVRA